MLACHDVPMFSYLLKLIFLTIDIILIAVITLRVINSLHYVTFINKK